MCVAFLQVGLTIGSTPQYAEPLVLDQRSTPKSSIRRVVTCGPELFGFLDRVKESRTCMVRHEVSSAAPMARRASSARGCDLRVVYVSIHYS